MMMKQKYEIFVGLDTHRETIHGTAMNKEKEILQSYEFPARNEMLEYFMEPFDPESTLVAIEACNQYRFAYTILKAKKYDVVLADPKKSRQHAPHDKKTDEEDSLVLADLSRVGYLPKVVILGDDILQLRDLCRHKSSITRMRSGVETKIKAYLSRNGISYEKGWEKKNILWLMSLKKFEVNTYLEIREKLKEEEKNVMKEIEKFAKANTDILRLKTIPGAGFFTATMMFEEIGDINRFQDVKHLHAYAGEVPGIHQSGSKTRTKKRIDVNYWLKWIMGQCVMHGVKKEGKLKRYYQKMLKKKGKKIAKKAAARKILTIAYYLLKENTIYHES